MRASAHLGVARASALELRTLQGTDADAARVRALAAYKDFLAIWEDADPGIPILLFGDGLRNQITLIENRRLESMSVIGIYQQL